MRLCMLAAAFALSTSLAAHADTFQFTFNGVAEPNPYGISVPPTESLSFQLSGAPVFYYNGQYSYYQYVSIPITFSFGSFAPGYQTDANVTLSGSIEPGGEQDISFYAGYYDPYGFGYLHVPVSFSTGPQSAPIVLPGTYGAQYETHNTRELYDGNLALTDLSTPGTVTPEPSTLALLASGLLGAATLRRRLIRS